MCQPESQTGDDIPERRETCGVWRSRAIGRRRRREDASDVLTHQMLLARVLRLCLSREAPLNSKRMKQQVSSCCIEAWTSSPVCAHDSLPPRESAAICPTPPRVPNFRPLSGAVASSQPTNKL
jgi:hypothetical protein